jgi:hypothetical protein
LYLGYASVRSTIKVLNAPETILLQNNRIKINSQPWLTRANGPRLNSDLVDGGSPNRTTYFIIDERIPVNGRESAVWPDGDDENDRQ